MKRVLMSGLLLMLGLGPVAAQEPPAPEKTPAAPAASRNTESGQAVNVRLELTITDQGTGASPAVRTVTLLGADRSVNRIRTQVHPNLKAGELNVDARPQILQGDRIQLNLTVEYRPGVSGSSELAPHTSQSLVVVLQDGKPLLLSQSADPNSDRKVKLEVKATILK